MVTWGRPVASCQFEVLAVWRLSAASVIERGNVGLYPLLPLMQWHGAGKRAVLETSQELILNQIVDRESRADAYVALRVLSGIGHAPDVVGQVLNRREIMLESPVYREIMEEGRALGIEQGLEEGIQRGVEQGRQQGIKLGVEQGRRQGIKLGVEQGLEEGIQQGIRLGVEQGRQQGIRLGHCEALRTSVLTVLQARFDQVPGAVIVSVQQIEEPDRLEALLRSAGRAASLAAFARELERSAPPPSS
jgi:predicted transposase YdaD